MNYYQLIPQDNLNGVSGDVWESYAQIKVAMTVNLCLKVSVLPSENIVH